jgi:hypothetical protein
LLLTALWTPLSAHADGKEVTLAPGITATTRYTANLEVPREQKTPIPVHVELGNWYLSDTSREIRVSPQQGFYIADLRNGEVVTTIDGVEAHRYGGELWAVKPGQSMLVKIVAYRHEGGVLLQIFSMRPGR